MLRKVAEGKQKASNVVGMDKDLSKKIDQRREKTSCTILSCLTNTYQLATLSQPLRVSGLLAFTFACAFLEFL